MYDCLVKLGDEGNWMLDEDGRTTRTPDEATQIFGTSTSLVHDYLCEEMRVSISLVGACNKILRNWDSSCQPILPWMFIHVVVKT
ncbi:hypothetical protein SLA2020_488140 [Shorea laevis]